MEYYILDNDLNVVRGVELFQSMIWTRKYYESGDFELYLPATTESFKTYSDAAKNHYYIIQAKDATAAHLKNVPIMVVNSVTLDDTFDKGDFLIVKGKQVKSLLMNRIVWGETKQVAGPVQDVFRQLVIENLINPTDGDRAIPNIILGDIVEDHPFNKPDAVPFVNADLTGSTLYDAFVKIAKDQHVGWDIVLDFTVRKLKFVMLGWTDRSRAQTETPWVTFSVEYDNLIKTSYKIDSDNYKNIALVASTYEEFDKSSRTVKTIDASKIVKPYKLATKPAGMNRYELYVKGDSVKLDDPTTSEVDVAKLNKNNETKGRTELEKYKSKIDISAEVSANITYQYDEDYFLGDMVTIQNEYGIRYDARVTSVTTTLTTSKDQTIPSFTIENYTGKEEDDEEKDTEDIRRVDENGNYRQTEYGNIRTIGKGPKFSRLLTEDGSERVAEDGSFRDVAVGHYDDSKYKLT